MQRKEPFRRIIKEELARKQKQAETIERLRPVIDKQIENRINAYAEKLANDGYDLDKITFDVHDWIDDGILNIEISASLVVDEIKLNIDKLTE